MPRPCEWSKSSLFGSVDWGAVSGMKSSPAGSVIRETIGDGNRAEVNRRFGLVDRTNLKPVGGAKLGEVELADSRSVSGANRSDLKLGIATNGVAGRVASPER